VVRSTGGGGTVADAPAAERAVAVLRHLARQARPVSAGAIARDLGIPRSSAYRVLDTLAVARFVTHFPEEQRWGLGVGAFELGSAYLRQEPLERSPTTPARPRTWGSSTAATCCTWSRTSRSGRRRW
jgi:DNA-binding IclR family transcriptional regulator